MATPNGTLVLKDGKIWMAQYDISADLYKMDISTTPDMKENTVFGASYHTSQAGLSKLKVGFDGYSKFHATAANAIDGRLYTNLSAVDIPFSFSADGGDAGEDAYFMKAMLAKYNFGGSIGEMAKFTCGAELTSANAALVKGTILEDGKTSRTSAGTGTVQTLGAVTAAQNVYGVLHLTAFVGTDVTFYVQNAVTNFATVTTLGTPSFPTAMTGVGSQYFNMAATTTNTFWRVGWSTSGGFTSFSAVVILGIM